MQGFGSKMQGFGLLGPCPGNDRHKHGVGTVRYIDIDIDIDGQRSYARTRALDM